MSHSRWNYPASRVAFSVCLSCLAMLLSGSRIFGEDDQARLQGTWKSVVVPDLIDVRCADDESTWSIAQNTISRRIDRGWTRASFRIDPTRNWFDYSVLDVDHQTRGLLNKLINPRAREIRGPSAGIPGHYLLEDNLLIIATEPRIYKPHRPQRSTDGWWFRNPVQIQILVRTSADEPGKAELAPMQKAKIRKAVSRFLGRLLGPKPDPATLRRSVLLPRYSVDAGDLIVVPGASNFLNSQLRISGHGSCTLETEKFSVVASISHGVPKIETQIRDRNLMIRTWLLHGEPFVTVTRRGANRPLFVGKPECLACYCPEAASLYWEYLRRYFGKGIRGYFELKGPGRIEKRTLELDGR